MTVLTPKKPFESKEPVIIVDELPIGAHVIRLVVVDDDGNSSDPFDVTVEVTEKGFVLPIDTTPPKVITTIPVPGDSITQVPITTIDAVPLTDVLKAAPVAKPTKTVKTTKPPATSKPTKPTNTKPGDQK